MINYLLQKPLQIPPPPKKKHRRLKTAVLIGLSPLKVFKHGSLLVRGSHCPRSAAKRRKAALGGRVGAHRLRKPFASACAALVIMDIFV